MVGCIAQSIHSAPLDVARVVTHLSFLITVSVVGAVVVRHALRFGFSDAVAVEVQVVAVFYGADADTSFVDDHSTFQVTHATASVVDLESLVCRARGAVAVFVQR